MLPRVVLVFVALLAGCAAPADPAANDTAPSSAAPAGPPEVTTIPVSRPAATPVGEPDASEQGTFEVTDGANETLIEARWSCTSPECGFIVLVYDDGGNEIGSSDGTGEVSFVETLAPGTYTAAIASTGPAVNMEGEIRVSVFRGAVPEGYSAFDA